MRKLLIIALTFIVSVTLAQTTIPIKDTALIRKITTAQSNFGIYHHYDIKISPTFNGVSFEAWANKYKGKWYSNYPYKIEILYNSHIVRVYENNEFIYGCIFGENKNYQFTPLHFIPIQKRP